MFYAQHEPYMCSLKTGLPKNISKHYTSKNSDFTAKCRLCPTEIHFWPICNASIWVLQRANHFGKYYLVSECTHVHIALATLLLTLLDSAFQPKLEKRHLALRRQHYMSAHYQAKHSGLWQLAYFSGENIKTESHDKIKS